MAEKLTLESKIADIGWRAESTPHEMARLYGPVMEILDIAKTE
ncbi:hypothetical protein [Rhizobium sp. BE258]|jgi:hypothetical protein|nr:hypothetical protein [Rhizobium sp. BE258]MDR7144276.1 hypothetical protein [Rhizobium sp. BE258]